MTIPGVDYSFARPSTTCLHEQGYRFAVRYFSVGPSGKNLTATEMSGILAAGLALVLVFEESAGRMLEGFTAGVADADAAKRSWTAIRPGETMPPVYFALDVDPRPLTPAQMAACQAYLNGAADQIGAERVGVYGGYRAMILKARWRWQTYAWSGGQWAPGVHLQQWRNGVSLCGGQVDLTRATTADYGQFPRPTGDPDMPLTSADKPIIAEAVGDALDAQARRVFGITSYERYLEVLLDAARDPAVADVDEAAVAAQVVAKLDPAVLAAAIAANLSTGQAAAVADEIKRRLEA